jgi:hypothetical protein
MLPEEVKLPKNGSAFKGREEVRLFNGAIFSSPETLLKGQRESIKLGQEAPNVLKE